MYADSFFANKWRVALWTVLLAFLLLPILASITKAPSASTKPSPIAQSEGLLDARVQLGDPVEEAEFESVVDVIDESTSDKATVESDLSSTAEKAAVVDISNTQFQPPVAETFVSTTTTDTEVIDHKDAREEVLESIELWRSAWERSDVQTYLDSYSPAFEPEEGELYQDWKDRRKRVVGQKQKRSIELDKLRLIFSRNGLGAGAQFEQNYESGSYSDKVLKRLYLKKINDEWKIAREHPVEELSD